VSVVEHRSSKGSIVAQVNVGTWLLVYRANQEDALITSFLANKYLCRRFRGSNVSLKVR
jgi:hypothetical protein